jgi:putative membrane protein
MGLRPNDEVRPPIPRRYEPVHLGSMWLLVGLVVLVWLVLVLSGAWLTATRPGHRRLEPTVRAREILADRYARGEIDVEEYRERLGPPREKVPHR